MNAQNVTQILDAIALRFGATAASLHAVLIRQVYIDGVIAALLILTFAIGGAYGINKCIKIGKAEKYDGEMWYFGAFLVGLCCFLLICFNISEVSYLFNPEFGALKLVLRAVGSN